MAVIPKTTIFGYGSLLNAASTALTCATSSNRRIGVLHGYQRVFSLVSISALRADPTSIDSLQIAALAIHPADAFVVGVLFDIDEAELEAYIKREARYRVVRVAVADGACIISAWTAIAITDDELVAERYGGEKSAYDADVGRLYSGSLWHREDILPSMPYVHCCINGAIQMGADVLVSLLGALCADRRTTLHSYLLQRPLYRILETPTGTRYNPGGPVIGPAVDKLSKPLIVVIAPPDVMAAAQPAYDACAESVDIAPLGLLCVDWCCDSMAAEAERMQAVISFVCASPTVHGCVIMSPPLQAVAHAAFLARCGSADAVKPACVECECACGDASRPVLATPVPCCPSPSTCCEDVTTVCCVSPHLLADEGANVSVLVKHSDGTVVGCALKDNGDALPAVHTFIEAFKLLHCCTKN